jgi:amidohydrolase
MLRLAGFVLFLLVATSSLAHSADRQLASRWADEHLAEILELYRELHAAPELSFEEEKTAARMAAELHAVGAEVTTGFGGHGLVGVIKNGEGKVLLLRADMDALPVVEETGLPFASRVRVKNERGQTVGVAHACGHDIHMANLVGVARFLQAHRDAWQGTAICLFQPAEEKGAGSQAMLDDGLLGKIPRPDYAVALHVAADVETGKVGFCPGYALANVDSVDIVVKGRGGHGAYPDTTIDPIVIAARLVLDLQTIVSREINPIEPAVITVGAIEGGTKHNVIGDTCRLQLTVRSYTPHVRQQLVDAIRRKAKAAAESAGAPEPEIEFSDGTPSLYNDPALTERLTQVARQTFGENRVEPSPQSMGGEDFSRYGLAGMPICMFRVGTVSPERLAEFKKSSTPPPSLHSPRFYPDANETLRTSLSAMGAMALELLPRE